MLAVCRESISSKPYSVPRIRALLRLSPRVDKKASKVWEVGLYANYYTVGKTLNLRTYTILDVQFLVNAQVIVFQSW